MSIFYYTMDDAGRRKPPSAKQSVVEQFHNLSDALARYRELKRLWEWPTVSAHWNWCAVCRCFPQTGKEKAFSHLIREIMSFGPNGQKQSWRWKPVSEC